MAVGVRYKHTQLTLVPGESRYARECLTAGAKVGGCIKVSVIDPTRFAEQPTVFQSHEWDTCLLKRRRGHDCRAVCTSWSREPQCLVACEHDDFFWVCEHHRSLKFEIQLAALKHLKPICPKGLDGSF